MNKTIYDEAIETLLDVGATFIAVPCNPIGEENSDMIHLRNATKDYESEISKVVKALVIAKKEHELLELYKEINNKRKELITLARYNTWSWELDIEIKDIQDKIKEKENDK